MSFNFDNFDKALEGYRSEYKDLLRRLSEDVASSKTELAFSVSRDQMIKSLLKTMDATDREFDSLVKKSTVLQATQKYQIELNKISEMFNEMDHDPVDVLAYLSNVKSKYELEVKMGIAEDTYEMKRRFEELELKGHTALTMSTDILGDQTGRNRRELSEKLQDAIEQHGVKGVKQVLTETNDPTDV